MERLTKIDKYGHPYTNENINCRNLVSENGINYQYVGYVDNFKAFDGKPIEKLSKLEDIEEAKRLIAEDTREQLRKYLKIEQELGIPLEVLFKALKDGIYTNWKLDVDKELKGLFKFNCLKLRYADYEKLFYLEDIYHPYGDRNCGDIGIYVFLKDYGKTWALTRDELEND